MKKSKINLYGAEWCSKTSMIRNYLQSQWIEFDYFDVEENEEAAEELRAIHNGKLKFPTVTLEGTALKNPTITELNKALKIR